MAHVVHARRGVAVRLLAGLAAASALLAVAGCSGSSLGGEEDSGKAASTLKIGFIADLSGVQKTVGVDQQKGVELYIAEHGGKLGGHKIDLKVADEGQSPEKAQAGLTKLFKQDGVVALTGVTQAATVNAAKRLSDSLQIPVVGSLGWPGKLENNEYQWSASFLSSDFGKAMGPYVADQVKGEKVFVLGPASQGGRDQIGGFVEAFTAAKGKIANPGGKPTFTPFPPQNENFVPYLQQVQASGAKAVYIFLAGGSAINFVKTYKGFGLAGKIPLFASGAVTEGAVLNAEGDAALDIKNCMNYAVDQDNAQNRAFVAAYQRKYGGSPTAYVMTGWDSAAILDRAIAQAGDNVSGKTINEAIKKIGQIDSPRGTWQFADNHAPVQKWYLRNVAKDGGVLSNVLVQELGTIGNS